MADPDRLPVPQRPPAAHRGVRGVLMRDVDRGDYRLAVMAQRHAAAEQRDAEHHVVCAVERMMSQDHSAGPSTAPPSSEVIR